MGAHKKLSDTSKDELSRDCFSLQSLVVPSARQASGYLRRKPVAGPLQQGIAKIAGRFSSLKLLRL